MDERYPYMRFVIGAAQPLAGAGAALVALGGLVQACSAGGFGGFVSFLATLLLAVVVYVAIQVSIESLRVFVDLERNSRELLHEMHDRSAGADKPS